MEQEPVYVASDRLRAVCEDVLGRIYDARQTQSQEYIESRVRDYNSEIHARNQKRNRWSWLGIKPKPYVTPDGMQMMVLDEMRAIAARDGDAALASHPMVQIQAQYGDIEHQTKDCMIQCAMNESVAVSADMVRGVSHFGLPLDFCRKRQIGFVMHR